MDVTKVCRCCLTGECYKDFSTEYYFGGDSEIYSEMLLNTFNITITDLKDVKKLICDECIRSLRDAANFKKQVETSEKTLSKMLGTKEIVTEDLKQECKDYDEEFDFDGRVDDNFVWDVGGLKDNKSQIFVIKLEQKDEDSQSLEKAPSEIVKKVSKSKNKLNKTKSALGRKLEKSLANTKHIKDINKSAVVRTTSTSQSQVASRENSLQLVLNSNICLFKSLKTKFGCFHCKLSFMSMPELREHTKSHSNVKNLKIRFNLLKGLSYKSVDISGLACNICSEACDDLNTLRTHLIGKHCVEFRDGDHFLIPYNLERGFKCVLCSEDFNTFTRLAIHMNSHYANNVCEICGVSYINRLSLRMHVSSVHKEKKCSKCSATFSTHYLKVKHMKKAHNVGTYKRYCLLCDKTFRYTYLLMEHRIQEHGAKRQVSDCPECGKTFLSPQNLKVHIRAVHIKERNFPCSVCGMRFFTKCDQKRHERTHEDVRSFSCGHCDGKFKTKDSWRRHLKRQHGHLYEVQ